MSRKLAVPAGLAMLALASSAHAASLVVNGSFEDVDPSYTQADKVHVVSPTVGGLTGWTIEQGSISLRTNSFAPASDGDWSLDLNAFISQTVGGRISQNLTTVVGQAYRLTFDMGDDNSNSPDEPPRLRVAVGDFFSQDYEFDDATFLTVPYVWKTFTVDFVAQSTSTSLRFGSLPGSDNIGLDNVSVVTLGVPEPATWAMMLIGFAGVGAAARRRRTGTSMAI